MMRGLMVLLAVWSLTCWADDGDGTEVPEALQLRPRILLKAYKDNELAADSQYKDKLLALPGVVRQVRKDASGEGLVALEAGDAKLEVQAFLAADATEGALGLRKGDLVQAKCVGNGYSPTGPLLKGCTVTALPADELKSPLRLARSAELCLLQRLDSLGDAGTPQQQKLAVQGRKAIAQAQKDLAKAKLVALPCGHPALLLLSACDGDDGASPECRHPAIRAGVGALQR